MSIASNIQAVTRTVSGLAIAGRTRVGGVYFSQLDTATYIKLTNGAADGEVLLNLPLPAIEQSSDVMIPDNGILFPDGAYLDTDAEAVTIFFEGGAGQPDPEPEV
jgi:hypothetical protein